MRVESPCALDRIGCYQAFHAGSDISCMGCHVRRDVYTSNFVASPIGQSADLLT
jgi:hypothetical protein